MENNPLDKLPSETRQRVEAALQALGGGMPQNVFVSQSPDVTIGNVPQQNAGTPGSFGNTPESFGGGTFQNMQQIFSTQFTNTPKQQAWLGQAWAHWEYEPYEWALFDKVDWEPTRNKARQKLIGGPIICIAIIAVFMAVIWVMSQSLIVMLLIGLAPAIILLTVLMLVMVSAGNSIKEAKKRYQARQNQAEPHRVTFSEKGVWESGIFFALNEILIDLKSVKLTANPSVLHFKMLKADLGNGNGRAGTLSRLQVLVPRGHEQEGQQLLQRYYAEVIKAKGTYNPLEPN